MPMIIEFREISKAFGGVQALKNASLCVKSGEVRALLGGNGSGKSTLIKIASGLIAQDHGDIYIDGQKVNVHTPKAAKRIGIVATSQELSILPNLTVAENIALCAIPKRRGGFTDFKAIRRRSLEVLRALGLEDKIDVPVAELALNEQYLIEFGKALFQDFDILMIDEITSALYAQDVQTVKHIIDQYKAQGKIILFVSHRMKELHDICDSVTVMRNGEIVETCNMADVNDDDLHALMIGERQQTTPAARTQAVDMEVQREVFIRVRDLPIARYGTHIDLDICKGEIIGVAGLQGHGQSDIVRALHGLNGALSIEMDNKLVHIRNPRDAVYNKIAFISGDREREGSFRQHNLAENVAVVQEQILCQRGSTPVQVLKDMEVKYASEFQGITSLSGGNQQKVIFGRWTHTHPALLLADDPSKGIDVHARSEMQGILKKLSDEGTSMIVVSSDDDELAKLCTVTPNARVIVMYEGNIVAVLKGQQITRDNIISATLSKGSKIS